MSSRAVCTACNRTIDDSAKLCPYCGANPATGERLDTQAILQEIFRPKEMTTSDSVMEFARQRQGVVIAVTVFIAFVIIAAVHQYVTMRNSNAVTDAPAVPLTEITDVTKKSDEVTPVPIPELNFQYEGRPQTMRTYVAEQGAITPPEALPPPKQPAAQPGAAAPAAPAPAIGPVRPVPQR
jgi:hypothetical protein